MTAAERVDSDEFRHLEGTFFGNVFGAIFHLLS